MKNDSVNLEYSIKGTRVLYETAGPETFTGTGEFYWQEADSCSNISQNSSCLSLLKKRHTVQVVVRSPLFLKLIRLVKKSKL